MSEQQKPRRRRKSFAVKLGRAFGSAIDATAETLERTGLNIPRISKPKPGTAAGIEHHQLGQMPTTSGEVVITCIDYSPDQVLVREIDDVEDFILHHRPEWSHVRWINVDGLSDMKIIQALAEKYELHPLAIEDTLHIPQRPKVDSYGDGTGNGDKGDNSPARLFIVVRMLQLLDGHLSSQQVSMFLGHKTLLTFQERRGDVWDPIRTRLNKHGSKLRQNDTSFLAYTLLDAVVDHCFPILEKYGDHLEELEELVLEKPVTATIHEIHMTKRELLLLRREVWPMREVIVFLQRETHECMSETARTYLRDVYDHTVQIIEIIETYREVANGLAETYLSAVNLRMNEVMKVLTMIATIFIPLTFLAGVYGMNFDNMPETTGAWAYPWLYPIGFWSVSLVISGTLLFWFRRRGWL